MRLVRVKFYLRCEFSQRIEAFIYGGDVDLPEDEPGLHLFEAAVPQELDYLLYLSQLGHLCVTFLESAVLLVDEVRPNVSKNASEGLDDAGEAILRAALTECIQEILCW